MILNNKRNKKRNKRFKINHKNRKVILNKISKKIYKMDQIKTKFNKLQMLVRNNNRKINKKNEL